jgi:hypothetical protein
MSSVALITLLAFVATAHAEDVPKTDVANALENMKDTDSFANIFLEKLTNRLLDRVNEASFPETNANLDSSTLGKPGHLQAISASAGELYQPEEEVEVIEVIPGRTLADEDSMLPLLLRLRGGATPKKAATPMKASTPMKAMAAMKAMKSPMKAPAPMKAMKAPMKAMKKR